MMLEELGAGSAVEASGNAYQHPRPGFPKLFVGSSKEQIGLSRALKAQLEDIADVVLWCDEGVFTHPHPPIVDLLDWASKVDYAVLIFAADDAAEHRSKRVWLTRDNVVLELGLFLARLGRERVLYLAPSIEDWKRPSDLLGVTPITYEQLEGKTADECILIPAGRVRQAIQTTWRPVPPLLLDRYNDLGSRFDKFTKKALARTCQTLGRSVTPDLAGGSAFEKLHEVFPTILPEDVREALESLLKAKEVVEFSSRGTGWEAGLSSVLDLFERRLLQVELWVNDDLAWRRLDNYISLTFRYDAVRAKAATATTALAKLLSDAAQKNPPVDITDASSENMLKHLVDETGVPMKPPSLHGAHPSYSWPDDGGGLWTEGALAHAEKGVAKLESFVQSPATIGLIAECHSLIVRYKKALLAAIAETHQETSTSPVAPSSATRVDQVELCYLYKGAFDRDLRLRAPRLALISHLDEMLREPDGSAEWQDGFRVRMSSFASRLVAYEQWQTTRRGSSQRQTLVPSPEPTPPSAPAPADKKRPWWRFF